MQKITFKERVNHEKLQKVINCSNIPIKSGEEEKAENIKEMLKKYNGTVTYYKNGYGRFFGTGLQSCQRDVRKYLADNNYIDIDIENAHLVFLENLMNHYSIPIPDLLKEYNSNRSKVIETMHLKDKLFMIKFINNEKCIDSRFKQVHNSIYNELLPKLQTVYPKFTTTKKDNKSGCFIATVLQDIENQILMVMVDYCKKIEVKVGVLCFDGFMVEKENYYPELLNELAKEVYLKLNYNIKLTEKSMDTDWIPECKNEIKVDENNKLLDEFNAITSSSSNIKKYDVIHSEITMKNKVSVQALIDTHELKDVHDCFNEDCKGINLFSECKKEGFKVLCKNCEFKFPPKGIQVDKLLAPQILNILIMNKNEDMNNKDTFPVAEMILNYINLIYTHDNKWFLFNEESGIYENKKDGNILGIMKVIADKMKDDGIEEDWFNWINKINYKKSLLEELKVECLKENLKLDENKYLLGFENGVFDLNDNIFRKGKVDEYVTMKCRIEYNEKIDSDLALNFLSDIFPEEDELEYVINKLSLCLEGYNREQMITFSYGFTASNGKSYLMEIMRQVMGFNCSTISYYFLIISNKL